MKKEVISLIVPIYNESEVIDELYSRILKVFEKTEYDFEMVCIDDGSKDDSLSKLLNLHSKDNRVKVVSFSRNFGKEIAMTAGIEYSSGDYLVPIDADLQDPPELIFTMMEKLKEGYDVVYATRAKREGESLFKKMTAILFYKIIGRMTSVPIPPDTGDFRIMKKNAVDALKSLKEKRRFMKGLFSWVGFNQVSITYQRKPRFAGKTKWNYWKLWNFAL